jgi:uncharacterized protein
MDMALAVLGWSAFVLAIITGLLLDLVGLFGNWIILGAVAIAWLATGFTHFSGTVIIVLLVLAILGEVVEFIASSMGAARFGASKGAMVAALVGCIVGAIVGAPFFLIIGAVVGALVGAFTAAAAYEVLMSQKDYDVAMRVGFGATVGKIGGILGKLAVGVLMVTITAFTF